MRLLLSAILGAALLAVAGTGSANAQATRTWVSGVGDDANPCARTAPCRTFAGAISKTAARGEINVLDPGSYGAVTITKSITIRAAGTEAAILASGTTGIVVNALSTDVVELEGLNLGGSGSGFVGIKILTPTAVHVRKSVIHQFQSAGSGTGVHMLPTTGTANVFISDTVITNNLQGLLLEPTGSGLVNVFLDKVSIIGNSGAAIRPKQGSTVTINNSTITGNGKGVFQGGNGLAISTGTNVLMNNNGQDGAFNSTVPQQ